MRVWTKAWLAWLVAFLAVEVPAAFRKAPDDTFSEHAWDWFSLTERKRYWLVRRGVFVVFWLSLGAHFMFQAPAGWSVIAPGVPFVAVVAYSLLFDAKKEGPVPEVKTYSGWKSLWKGLEPALVVGATAALLAFADVATADMLTGLGLPSMAAVFVVATLKNWAKNRKLGKDSVGPRV